MHIYIHVIFPSEYVLFQSMYISVYYFKVHKNLCTLNNVCTLIYIYICIYIWQLFMNFNIHSIVFKF